MTDTRTFQCPNCGSPLTTTGAETEVTCPYCGSTAIVPKELRSAPAPQPTSTSAFEPSPLDDRAAQNLQTSASTIETRHFGGRCALFGIGAAAAVVLMVGIISFAGRLGLGSQSDAGSGNGANAPLGLAIPAATPTQAIPTPVPFTKVLFADDFSSTASGWPRARNTKYVLEYESGQYHVQINEQGAGQEVTSATEKTYSDVSIQVDVQQTAGPADGLMGVTCRNDNNGNFYSFEISPDGTYGIYKYSKDSGDALDEETLSPNTVNQNGLNRVEGVCQGDTLTLLLNGQVLTQVQDSSYTKGQVGLLVRTGSSGDPGEDVLFGHLVVKGP